MTIGNVYKKNLMDRLDAIADEMVEFGDPQMTALSDHIDSIIADLEFQTKQPIDVIYKGKRR